MQKGLISRLARRLFPPKAKVVGYEHPEVVETVFQKTLAYSPKGDWPEIAGATSVLDFGGGAGRHYKEAKSSSVRWAVVETHEMVRRASELTTDRLHFFSDIQSAAAWLGTIEIVHCNGALHFPTNPSATLAELCALRAPKMLWYRVHFGTEVGTQISHLVDNGPGTASPLMKNKLVEYDYRKMPEAEFLAAHRDYNLAARGDDWFVFTLK